MSECSRGQRDTALRREATLSAAAPETSSLPAYVLRRPTGRYQSLNPLTKLTVALAAAAIAFVIRGWTGPAVVFVVVLATAIVANVTRPALRVLVLTSPLVISILLVNTFLFPGAKDVITRIGPLAPTWTGLEAALQAVLRVAAFALSVAVFSMTTPTDDLLADLERRGVGRRAVFVIGAAIRTVPRMRDRAGEITDSQRARGLDTEGSRWKRIAGIVPLAGPMIFGALAEVEEQTMALEARAFSSSGRRTVLRTFADPAAERAARWLIVIGSVAAIVASVAGVLRLP